MPPIGAIAARYNELGGPTSWLGASTSDEMDFDQGGKYSTFERGNIYWWPDTGAIDLANVALRFRGLYAFGVTDGAGADEPYVTFGVVPFPPVPPSTMRSPIYDDVDEGNARPDMIEMCRGMPYGVELGGILWEHDSGDPNLCLPALQAGADAAGGVITGACSAYGGAPLGTLCGRVWGEVGPAAANFINDLLGTGDDEITRWAWHVSPRDMVTKTRQPRQNWWGIEYHMESELLSGLGASYKVYVDVEPV
jgi:hypothetical protein